MGKGIMIRIRARAALILKKKSWKPMKGTYTMGFWKRIYWINFWMKIWN